MSFFKKEKLTPEYQGNADVYSGLQNIINQSPESQVSFGYAPNMERLLTQAGLSAQGIGTSPLTSLANQYMQNTTSGQGLNPYEEGSPYQQYQQAAMQNFNQNVMPQVATGAASRGLLRGSAGQNATSQAMTNLGNQLQQQGYNAYQQGLQRQYGMAQFAPQQQLNEQNAMLSGLLNTSQGYGNLGQMLAGAQQQNIGNQLNAGQAMNSSYAIPQYTPSGFSQLLSGIGQLGGQVIGAAGQAQGLGKLFAL